MSVCLLFVKNSGYLCNWELLATLAEMNCFVSGKLLTWEGKMHRGMICTFQKKKLSHHWRHQDFEPKWMWIKSRSYKTHRHKELQDFLDQITLWYSSHPSHQSHFLFMQISFFQQLTTEFKVLTTPCLRTVLYTAALKYTGTVDSPLQCASNLLRASAKVGWSPLRPIQPNTRTLNSASKWPRTIVDN